MHILVVNDDGPPNDGCSPYILPFVTVLQGAGHTVSVVLPETPQSWISKAHLVGKALTARPFYPGILSDSDVGARCNEAEWTLVDGTPASCTQLGLFHLTSHRGQVDLVISGPNWGRNVTTLYNLASGTVGGALEAAQCGKRAIAISFASKSPQPKELIKAACNVSSNIIAYLCQSWAPEAELYAINVPMIPDVGSRKVMYTRSLPCYWTQSSLFQEAGKIKMSGDSNNLNGSVHDAMGKREFKWQPELQDVQRSIDTSIEATDGWAMREGFISVTPMVTTFKSVDSLYGTAVLQ